MPVLNSVQIQSVANTWHQIAKQTIDVVAETDVANYIQTYSSPTFYKHYSTIKMVTLTFALIALVFHNLISHFQDKNVNNM